MKTIMFCGHSKVNDPEKVREWLFEQVEEKITEGATEFFLGGYGEFDNLAADVVYEHIKRYSYIRSVLVLAYPDLKIDSCLYTESVYPSLEKITRKFAIVNRNRWMVDNSDTVLAYVIYDWGGAAKTFDYEKNKRRSFPTNNKKSRTYHPALSFCFVIITAPLRCLLCRTRSSVLRSSGERRP